MPYLLNLTKLIEVHNNWSNVTCNNIKFRSEIINVYLTVNIDILLTTHHLQTACLNSMSRQLCNIAILVKL